MTAKHTDKIQEEETDGRDGRKKKGAEHIEEDEEIGMAWDDLSGEERPAKEVRKARLQEIKYIEDKKAWRKISRTDAQRRQI